jgi:hypothetical protein
LPGRGDASEVIAKNESAEESAKERVSVARFRELRGRLDEWGLF